MNKEQFESIRNSREESEPRVTAEEICAAIGAGSGVSTTLLYGYTCDRYTFHVFIDGGCLFVQVFNSVDGIISSDVGTSFRVADLVPDKRVYPRYTLLEFANLLTKKGMNIPFTDFHSGVTPLTKDNLFFAVPPADIFDARKCVQSAMIEPYDGSINPDVHHLAANAAIEAILCYHDVVSFHDIGYAMRKRITHNMSGAIKGAMEASKTQPYVDDKSK